MCQQRRREGKKCQVQKIFFASSFVIRDENERNMKTIWVIDWKCVIIRNIIYHVLPCYVEEWKRREKKNTQERYRRQFFKRNCSCDYIILLLHFLHADVYCCLFTFSIGLPNRKFSTKTWWNSELLYFFLCAMVFNEWNAYLFIVLLDICQRKIKMKIHLALSNVLYELHNRSFTMNFKRKL